MSDLGRAYLRRVVAFFALFTLGSCAAEQCGCLTDCLRSCLSCSCGRSKSPVPHDRTVRVRGRAAGLAEVRMVDVEDGLERKGSVAANGDWEISWVGAELNGPRGERIFRIEAPANPEGNAPRLLSEDFRLRENLDLGALALWTDAPSLEPAEDGGVILRFQPIRSKDLPEISGYSLALEYWKEERNRDGRPEVVSMPVVAGTAVIPFARLKESMPKRTHPAVVFSIRAHGATKPLGLLLQSPGVEMNVPFGD